ncbi:hypothetical protein L596_012938 [Steinernema carpocapsae]|uniref:Uncharacterized protein n=1 Tax=Steinernema carpocapsae TaxID=34508 RepID=A0A4U5NZ61_STECR|nr:hypothetical protein L596_012938 [Steinernema carpocapsae]
MSTREGSMGWRLHFVDYRLLSGVPRGVRRFGKWLGILLEVFRRLLGSSIASYCSLVDSFLEDGLENTIASFGYFCLLSECFPAAISGSSILLAFEFIPPSLSVLGIVKPVATLVLLLPPTLFTHASSSKCSPTPRVLISSPTDSRSRQILSSADSRSRAPRGLSLPLSLPKHA